MLPSTAFWTHESEKTDKANLDPTALDSAVRQHLSSQTIMTGQYPSEKFYIN